MYQRLAEDEVREPAREPDLEALMHVISAPLRQALVGALGIDRGLEAHALAMAHAWEHRHRVAQMEFPAAYLFKVGRSKSRDRRKPVPRLYAEPSVTNPEYEPELVRALAQLPEKQRMAVFLVVGCQWRYVEVARATSRSESTVRALVERGLRRLRDDLKEDL